MLYSEIERYADKNYIYPTDCKFGNFYKIKFDNIGFEISMLVEQETLFSCKRVQIEDEKEFLNFDDIISDKQLDTTIKTKNSLT